MKPDFFSHHKHGRVLLGITNEGVAFTTDGRTNFMDGVVQDATPDDIAEELGKRLGRAAELGFGDCLIIWPRQHICIEPGGYCTKKTVGYRPLPLERIAEICRKTKTYLCLMYAEGNVEMDAARVAKFQKKSGHRFLGECLGEIGGRTWFSAARLERLRTQQNATGPGALKQTLAARNMREAKRNYVDYVRRRVRKWLDMDCPPSFPVDGTTLHRYNLEAGVGFAGVEVCDRLPRNMAAARGASRSYGKTFWCSYIPLGHYFGSPHNTPAKIGRWKVSLDLSYLMGASLVINENGVFSTQLYNLPRRGDVHNLRSPFCRKTSGIYHDFARFTKLHRRPQGHPEASIAVMQGHLDGWNGTPQSDRQRVWAQHGRGEHWKLGAAERSWQYLDSVFYPGGKWLSGMPYGPVDVISSDAPVSVMKAHRFLVFLGWNTMTKGLLIRLERFVRAGGTLLMSLPHLSTSADRGSELDLVDAKLQKQMFGAAVRRGAYPVKSIRCVEGKRLAGMKKQYPIRGQRVSVAEACMHDAEALAVSGSRPALSRHSLGKGVVYLNLCRNYPGEPGLERFFTDLLKALSKEAVQNGDLSVAGSPYLDYAVYGPDGDRPRTLYLFEYEPRHDEYPDGTAGFRRHANRKPPRGYCRVTVGGRSCKLALRPNELRVVYILDDMVVSPASRYAFPAACRSVNTRTEIVFRGEGRTSVHLMPLRAGRPAVKVQGKRVTVRSEDSAGCFRFSLDLAGNAKVEILRT